MRFKPGALAAMTLAAGALFTAAGCGSDESSSSASDAGAQAAEGDPARQALIDQVDELKQRPTEIGPTTPVENIPSGKKIALVECGVEDCKIQGDSLQEATDVLGWELVRVKAGVTPESIKGGWQQALRADPDAIVEGGFPHAYFQDEIDEAEQRKIPVVGLTDPDPIAPPVIQNIGSQDYLERLGVLFADWVGAHVTEGEIGAVGSKDLPTVVRQVGSATERLKETCPDCTVVEQNIPIASFGKDAASKIAGFYQANPNLAYSMMSLADMGIGLPQALAGASVEAPETVYASGNPVTLGYMQKDEANLQANIVYSTVEVPWRAADALARHFTGMSVEEDSDATLPNWYMTPDNIPPEALKGPIPWVADFQDQYKKLWGKG